MPSDRVQVAFLFPGQGTQHPGMGRDLYRTDAVYRRAVDHAARILEPELGLDIRSLLLADEADADAAARLRETANAQPALFVVEQALVELWRSWGIEADACIGHSLGEFSALVVPDAGLYRRIH